MPPRAVAAAPGAGPGGQGAEAAAPPSLQGLLQTVMRLGMMWWMFNSFMKPGGQQAGAGGAAGAGNVQLKPLHARGTPFDVRVLLSESPELPSLANGTLIWQQDGVGLGTTPELMYTHTYSPSEVRARGAARAAPLPRRQHRQIGQCRSCMHAHDNAGSCALSYVPLRCRPCQVERAQAPPQRAPVCSLRCHRSSSSGAASS